MHKHVNNTIRILEGLAALATVFAAGYGVACFVRGRKNAQAGSGFQISFNPGK